MVIALPLAFFAAMRSGMFAPLEESSPSPAPIPAAAEPIRDREPEAVILPQTTTGSRRGATLLDESAPAPAVIRSHAPVAPAVRTRAADAASAARTANDRLPGVAPASPLSTPTAVERPRFEGTLSVESLVEGARVYVDGKPVGATPLANWVVPAGSHVVRVEHEGYERWSAVIQVVAGNARTVVADLRSRERD